MVFQLKRRSLMRARLRYEYRLFKLERDAKMPVARPPIEQREAFIRHLAFGYEETRFHNKLKQYAFLLDVGFHRTDDAYIMRRCERLIAQFSTILEAHRLLLELDFSEEATVYDRQLLDAYQDELAGFTADLKE